MSVERTNHYTITKKKASEIADEFAKEVGGESIEDCHEYTVNLPDSIGSGHVRFIDFADGLSLIIYDFNLNQPINLRLKNESLCLLRFSYVINGHVRKTIHGDQVKLTINTNAGIIYADNELAGQCISFEIGETRMLCIQIDREKYLNKIKCEVKYLPDTLEEIFLDKDCEKKFLHHHNYLHTIHEAAINIFDSELEGIVRRTYIESCTLEILSQQVLEFVNEHESSGIDIRQIDVEQLKEAREILKNRLKEGISIKELSRKVGLNQNKLKHGFKRVFGHTINAYLLKLRLDKARLLIASNNSSLKEVAEEVGYANKSFFARKFKERYGVLPREFKKELEA